MVPLVEQYRSLLRGLEWPQLWRKLWQVLCWMPAMWVNISYTDSSGQTLLDERIYALKTERKVYSYASDTAWDDMCRNVLPMEDSFPDSCYMRIVPQHPHLPERPAKMRKFREGAFSFIHGGYTARPSDWMLWNWVRVQPQKV